MTTKLVQSRVVVWGKGGGGGFDIRLFFQSPLRQEYGPYISLDSIHLCLCIYVLFLIIVFILFNISLIIRYLIFLWLFHKMLLYNLNTFYSPIELSSVLLYLNRKWGHSSVSMRSWILFSWHLNLTIRLTFFSNFN